MWQCPVCQRAFERNDQNHACVPITVIDEYIAQQEPEVQPLLNKLREVIRAAAPDSTEKIAWQMPTFWQKENLCHFAACKKHIGIYPGGEVTTVFAERLAGYKTSKGCIQLPLKRDETGAYKELDWALVTEIVQWRLAQATKIGAPASASL
ncbi:hypothetical protein FACS1894184_06930 [Clostridia bacterium]|nr:hypothetical protein FACS1894184_06930 [Clostridia bacterium]